MQPNYFDYINEAKQARQRIGSIKRMALPQLYIGKMVTMEAENHRESLRRAKAVRMSNSYAIRCDCDLCVSKRI